MTNEMRIKVKKQFLSPLTNRLAEVGEEMNVPLKQFWLKRVMQGDCEEVKLRAKAAPKSLGQSKNSKGSK